MQSVFAWYDYKFAVLENGERYYYLKSAPIFGTNLKTEFSMRNATNFAGSKVILAFLETIGLIQGLQTLGLPKAANALFPPHRILQYLIIGWLLGCERLFHFKSLKPDALIRHALGGRLPHHMLLNMELLRFVKSHGKFGPKLRELSLDLKHPYCPNKRFSI